MSSYIVSDDHINFLMNAAVFVGLEVKETATKRGEQLLIENARCVQELYREENVAADGSDIAGGYEFTKRDVQRDCGLLDVVQVLKALDCYEYQCCQSKKFYSSDAHGFCNDLRKLAGQQLKGYSAATWEL